MSLLLDEIFATAAESRRGLSFGTATEPVRHGWGEVHELACRMAGALAGLGVGPGASVAVLAADAGDVAPLVQAIWMRRAAITMLQHPTLRTDLTVWLADTVRVVQMLHADLILVDETFSAALYHVAGMGFPATTVAALRLGEPIGPEDAQESDVALRQLTSGSTGTPKAVEISHANVAANTVAIRNAVDLDLDSDVSVSWLPLSHDMGMIGLLCLPMQVGIETVVVTPDQFLRRPILWAELISKHRATFTSGPSFAYSVLARLLQRADPSEIDLSTLRVAVNGAEPIDHRDLTTFTAAGARFGLRDSVFRPAYGLAETTLVVSFAPPDTRPIVDRVSRDGVAVHHALPIAGDDQDQATSEIVCVGAPVHGMEVRVRRDGVLCAPRGIGAIEVRGPAVASRYLTEDGVVPIADADGWFDTGDLGYLDECGRLYVCGRTKDLIVIGGKNLYPSDIERAAAGVEGVRKGCVAAVRIDAGVEREGFAVLAEVHQADDDQEQSRVSQEIAARVLSHTGHTPRVVKLLCAGTLPKTPSGKLRRNDAGELLLS